MKKGEALNKILVLIPARYASVRFPGKSLAQIKGKSLVQRVFENCQSADRGIHSHPELQFQVAVVTDSQRIEDHVRGFGGDVIRVDEDVASGSERVYLGWQRWMAQRGGDFELIVNVQGDEPLLQGEDLHRLVCFHLSSSFDITTLACPCTGLGDEGHRRWEDPHRVKMVWNSGSGHCFYFSRAPIPFVRDALAPSKWWLHMGIYSYRPHALNRFFESPCGVYEKQEKLEQLRALEIGLSIGATDLPPERVLVGVDTPQDIEEVEKYL